MLLILTAPSEGLAHSTVHHHLRQHCVKIQSGALMSISEFPCQWWRDLFMCRISIKGAIMLDLIEKFNSTPELFMCNTLHIRRYNVKFHWKVQGRNSTPKKSLESLSWTMSQLFKWANALWDTIMDYHMEATEDHLLPQEFSSTYRIRVHLYRNWVQPTGLVFIPVETNSNHVCPTRFLWKQTQILCFKLDSCAKKWASVASVLSGLICSAQNQPSSYKHCKKSITNHGDLLT